VDAAVAQLNASAAVRFAAQDLQPSDQAVPRVPDAASDPALTGWRWDVVPAPGGTLTGAGLNWNLEAARSAPA
jgi:hypothetical protein